MTESRRASTDHSSPNRPQVSDVRHRAYYDWLVYGQRRRLVHGEVAGSHVVSYSAAISKCVPTQGSLITWLERKVSLDLFKLHRCRMNKRKADQPSIYAAFLVSFQIASALGKPGEQMNAPGQGARLAAPGQEPDRTEIFTRSSPVQPSMEKVERVNVDCSRMRQKHDYVSASSSLDSKKHNVHWTLRMHASHPKTLTLPPACTALIKYSCRSGPSPSYRQVVLLISNTVQPGPKIC